MGNHKVNLDADSLIQYLNQEKDNFYELMISFLNTIGIFNDNIIESIEEIFKEKYINLVDGLNEENKSSDEININSNDDDSSSDQSYEKNIILDGSENETNKVNIYSKLNKEETYLLDGDELIIEKINKKKLRKKISLSENNNLLNELNIYNINIYLIYIKRIFFINYI